MSAGGGDSDGPVVAILGTDWLSGDLKTARCNFLRVNFELLCDRVDIHLNQKFD